VLDRDEILIVERVEDRQILGMRLHVGSRLPAYCTSVGHVLLAGLPVHEVARRLEGVSLVVHGPSTITSLPRLLQRLEEVRAQGYALSDEELAVGHRAVAAPVRDWNGDVIAAINVSVPSARVSADEMRERVSPLVREAARAIESDLRGFGGAVRAGQVAAGRSGK
jgi:IclR family pca regulon transcriptional regulator